MRMPGTGSSESRHAPPPACSPSPRRSSGSTGKQSPRRYYLLADGGKYSTDYCVTETRCDPQVPDEDLQIPDDNARGT